MQLSVIIHIKYPYGTREPYIETEVNILKNYFSSIIIISNNTNSKISQPITEILQYLNSFELNLLEKMFH